MVAGEEVRREEEEAGRSGGQVHCTRLVTIVEGLLPGERDMLNGSKNEGLGLSTPSRSHPLALGIWGQKDKEDTGTQIRHYTGRQTLTENSIIMSSWYWEKIKSFFENKIVG